MPTRAKMVNAKSGTKTPEYGSDLILEMMRAYDIEFVALVPGATFRGIHDSIVNYGGNKEPEIIECTHEEVSVAIAHGYAKAKGKPMAAICHNVVGLMHASMAIFDAFVDRVPVIVMGGTGPMSTVKRRPWIDWIHTALVQGNLVRDYVKWDDQPYDLESIPESFVRAYAICMAEPKGPVYLCYDRLLQEKRIENEIPLPNVNRYSTPTRVQGDPLALDKTAEMLLYAENPVILAGTVGRNSTSVEHLIALTEASSTPVFDLLARFNFPSTHPLDVTGTKILESADFILSLDVQNITSGLQQCAYTLGLPTSERTKTLRRDVKIAAIDLNHLAVKSLITDFQALQPTDIHITADTSLAIPYLVEKCKDIVNGYLGLKGKLSERSSKAKGLHDEAKAKWIEQSKRNWDASPITPARLAYEIWQVISHEDWALATGTMAGWARKLWSWTKPYHYHGDSGGAGVGYGPGGSIGVALAYRGSGKLVLALLGDGDALMSCNALWTAAHHRIPLLVILENNRSYLNDAAHQIEVARTRGRSVETADVGTELNNPPPDFAKLAVALGCYGEGPIEAPDEVGSALQRAVRRVKEEKTLALVDAIVQRR